MEEKVCKGCGKPKPITQFQRCCDSYSGEKKWRRNICNHCLYLRKIGKGLPQFTQANT